MLVLVSVPCLYNMCMYIITYVMYIIMYIMYKITHVIMYVMYILCMLCVLSCDVPLFRSTTTDNRLSQFWHSKKIPDTLSLLYLVYNISSFLYRFYYFCFFFYYALALHVMHRLCLEMIQSVYTLRPCVYTALHVSLQWWMCTQRLRLKVGKAYTFKHSKS